MNKVTDKLGPARPKTAHSQLYYAHTATPKYILRQLSRSPVYSPVQPKQDFSHVCRLIATKQLGKSMGLCSPVGRNGLRKSPGYTTEMDECFELGLKASRCRTVKNRVFTNELLQSVNLAPQKQASVRRKPQLKSRTLRKVLKIKGIPPYSPSPSKLSGKKLCY